MQYPPIYVREPAGLERVNEPVTFGLPLPKGRIADTSNLGLQDEAGGPLAAAFTPLVRWNDSSLMWLLCDAQVSLLSRETRVLFLSEQGKAQEDGPELSRRDEASHFHLLCGRSELDIGKDAFPSSFRVTYNGQSLLKDSEFVFALTDDQGGEWLSEIGPWRIQSENRMRLALTSQGTFRKGTEEHPLSISSRLEVCAGQDVVRLDLTLHNPCAARHPGNVWDLGDPGSCWFEDVSLRLGLGDGLRGRICLEPEPGREILQAQSHTSVYQDSSGGVNWGSSNHVNHRGEIPLRFPGYEVRMDDQVVLRDMRAQPVLAAEGEVGAIGLSPSRFWQNFPKGLRADGNSLGFELFPREHDDLFELQGGEQKTHTVYLAFADRAEDVFARLARTEQPIEVVPDGEWMRRSRAVPGFVPAGLNPSRDEPGEETGQSWSGQEEADRVYAMYQDLIDSGLHGRNSFFQRREKIDEYGWRHFGDLYADHEGVFHTEGEAFVSHYNNQYDVIKGALCQFWRTGGSGWFRLAAELADHVADIDIYHTDRDRYQYNHGLFWHTDHHLHAATATHRAISRDHARYKDAIGGGPAPDHNYATGLCLMYWMTGEERYKRAALELAEHISQLVLGPDTFAEAGYQLLKRGLLRLKPGPQPGDPAFEHVYGLLEGPGRASGNGLNTLLDAYLLTGERGYLEQAEQIIWCCVSPQDDLEAMDLLNAELRWMYTVFLKALTRYIQIRETEEQPDLVLAFAKASFIHYALWMLDRERPYLDRPEILEFPNETWAAQEIRKSDVLALAGEMLAGEVRDRFLDRSYFFFSTGMSHLRQFENRTLTRPLVLLLTNGMEHADIYGRWVQGRLEQGQDKEEILRGWRRQSPPGRRGAVRRRLLHIASRTSPAREFRWVRHRLFSR